MAITLAERTVRAAETAQVKATLAACDYSVSRAAFELGLRQPKLSHMLNNSPAYRAWWARMKIEKKKRNRKARVARWRARRGEAVDGWES